MGTEDNPDPHECLDKALPDEPMFVLLARDTCAPHTVRQWAYKRERAIVCGERPESDRAQVAEARAVAKAMERWREDNDGRWK